MSARQQLVPSGPPSRTAPEPVPVDVDDVSVVLGASLVLSQVRLRVSARESVALLGANGSGKSTLVRTCLGLVPVSAGSVRLFGHDVRQRRQVPWGRVGYVPQRVTAGAGVPATALEVARSGLIGPHAPFADRGRRATARAMDALDAVGLAHRAHDHVQVFSGGQSQRVLIARALVREPDLLVLDEPLAGIDRASREALAEVLLGLRRQGMTLVTVLHEMGELAEVVQRAVLLNEGRVVADGAASHVLARQQDQGLVLSPDPHSGHGPTQRVPHHAPALLAGTNPGVGHA